MDRYVQNALLIMIGSVAVSLTLVGIGVDILLGICIGACFYLLYMVIQCGMEDAIVKAYKRISEVKRKEVDEILKPKETEETK